MHVLLSASLLFLELITQAGFCTPCPVEKSSWHTDQLYDHNLVANEEREDLVKILCCSWGYKPYRQGALDNWIRGPL